MPRIWIAACAIAANMLAAPSSIAGSAPARDADRPAPLHAKGAFTAEVTPESDARFGMKKTFAGAMAGISTGTMIGDTVVTAYVAMERFTGTLDGRKGSFLLLHRGYVSSGAPMVVDALISPNSGTGELTGINGRLNIDIVDRKHLYDLDYTLPSK